MLAVLAWFISCPTFLPDLWRIFVAIWFHFFTFFDPRFGVKFEVRFGGQKRHHFGPLIEMKRRDQNVFIF